MLGADQLYAGNLQLGLTRLMLQVGAWCSLVLAGCLGVAMESMKVDVVCVMLVVVAGLTDLGVFVWAVVDLVRWIVGGYYGTRGCPLV